jgi:hypothetical protein
MADSLLANMSPEGPAWTPLFAGAVAVVTDGGWLAAHASLVARDCRLRRDRSFTSLFDLPVIDEKFDPTTCVLGT